MVRRLNAIIERYAHVRMLGFFSLRPFEERMNPFLQCDRNHDHLAKGKTIDMPEFIHIVFLSINKLLLLNTHNGTI